MDDVGTTVPYSSAAERESNATGTTNGSQMLQDVLRSYGTLESLTQDVDYLVRTQSARGRSGATLTPETSRVTKAGQPGSVLGKRVAAQGHWMMAHACPALPVVHEIFQDEQSWGYSMERLIPLPLELLHGESLTREIIRLLRDWFWHESAQVRFDEAAHADRLRPITGPLTGYYREIFEKLYSLIDWDHLTTGLTHGDPIFDNVLFRRDGALVLSDPIPATPALPDLLAVDVGRVFQSCIGYERVTYGLRGPGNVPLDLVTVANALPEQDLIASFYFGIVHLLRAMVYVPTATATLLLEECVGRLIEEVTWRL